MIRVPVGRTRRKLSKRQREILVAMLCDGESELADGEAHTLRRRGHISIARDRVVPCARYAGAGRAALPGFKREITYKLTRRGANVARQLVKLQPLPRSIEDRLRELAHAPQRWNFPTADHLMVDVEVPAPKLAPGSTAAVYMLEGRLVCGPERGNPNDQIGEVLAVDADQVPPLVTVRVHMHPR